MAKMAYELSQHARDVLQERQIRVEWLEGVLNAPQRIEPDALDAELEHRLGRISEYGDRVLRVIMKPSARPARVISVYFDRAMRGKL
jgi:hypothetical protein